MNRAKLICVLILSVALASIFAPAARANDAEDAIKHRLEQRYPDLLAAKTTGKIGENTVGLVEAVDSKYLVDGKLKKLIDDENGDRTALYEIIAGQEQTTAAIVADRAAKRNYDKARTGDFLKDKDGAWYQKS